MNIIKLNAIDSTNSYLIRLGKKERLKDPTIVVAEEQLQGRGQLGASWQSKPLQSLTFSVFTRFKNLEASDMAAVTFAVSIAVYTSLQKFIVPKLAIKWPNDIMSHSKKLAGILIENQIKDSAIVSTVIGVGLNVNETHFKNLPHATSMLLETGTKHDLDEVLASMSQEILNQLQKLETHSLRYFKKEYEKLLFKKDKISVFENQGGTQFNGIIKGVSDGGELLVENEDETVQSFHLKEVRYLL